jgi:hypothetical protein
MLTLLCELFYIGFNCHRLCPFLNETIQYSRLACIDANSLPSSKILMTGAALGT